LTAKEAATLDVISGGRVAVTVGIGGRENDYRAVGAPFDHRHQRLDDMAAVMKKVWRGEQIFEGADEVGPVSPQCPNIPLYVGAMGPKGIARAAKWSDGIYGTSMAGDREGHERIFDMAKQAWKDAGRTDKPYLMGSFWYSLAPNAEQELKSYVYEYIKYMGEDIGRGMASMMTRFTPDAVREGIENVRAAGADELLIVPVTTHYDEIDRLAEIVG
jgi:alkanesulfonate monooxygenase SsuD/methylene tetrahydromethanopterin reductase-like flavin-dependent oxidoreductase (luciferase family)